MDSKPQAPVAFYTRNQSSVLGFRGHLSWYLNKTFALLRGQFCFTGFQVGKKNWVRMLSILWKPEGPSTASASWKSSLVCLIGRKGIFLHFFLQSKPFLQLCIILPLRTMDFILGNWEYNPIHLYIRLMHRIVMWILLKIKVLSEILQQLSVDEIF